MLLLEVEYNLALHNMSSMMCGCIGKRGERVKVPWGADGGWRNTWIPEARTHLPVSFCTQEEGEESSVDSDLLFIIFLP